MEYFKSTSRCQQFFEKFSNLKVICPSKYSSSTVGSMPVSRDISCDHSSKCNLATGLKANLAKGTGLSKYYLLHLMFLIYETKGT